MLESFEYLGVFWLPENHEIQLPGTLKFSQSEGATLDLLGDFENVDYESRIDIILGTIGKDTFTLSNCYRIHDQYTSPSYWPPGDTKIDYSKNSKYQARRVYKGVSFGKPEDIKFHKIYLDFHNLDEWVNNSGFNSSYDTKNSEIAISGC